MRAAGSNGWGIGISDGPFPRFPLESLEIGEHHTGHFGVLGVRGLGSTQEGLKREKGSFDG